MKSTNGEYNSGITRGAFLGLLLCSTGLAQDALRSNLAVDQTVAALEQPTIDLNSERPHWGPVQAALSLNGSVQYNDNLNTSAFQPQADTLLSVGMNASFFWPATERSTLSLNSGLTFVHFISYSKYDRVDVAPNTALAYQISMGDSTLSLYDQFSYTESVVTEGALNGLASFPRLDNDVGARLSWTPRKWLFEAGYGHDTFFSDVRQFEYVNRTSEFFFGRAGWRLAEKTQAGFEASASRTTYDLPIQDNNTSISVGPYADWHVTQAIHASLRGGPTFYFFENTRGGSAISALNSYYLSAVVEHQLTEDFSHRISLQRDVRLGLNQGSDYIEMLTTSYSFSWALTSRISLGGNVVYENGRQPLSFFTFQLLEKFDRYGGGPTISYRIANKTSLNLAYYYWSRTSNLPGQGYTQNTLTLGLNYAF